MLSYLHTIEAEQSERQVPSSDLEGKVQNAKHNQWNRNQVLGEGDGQP
jgi:hypothetical protein